MRVITVTDAAVSRVQDFISSGDRPEEERGFLRVGIAGGGCSGFQYSLQLDVTEQEGDIVQDEDGFQLRVNSDAVELLTGAELDFVEELNGSGFKFNNPNAVASCGCGSSFRAADTEPSCGAESAV